MEVKEILQQYKALKKELKALPGVQVKDVGTRPGISPQNLAKWEEKAKCQLPESLKNYYEATNGHRIIWHKESDGQLLMGRSAAISLPGGLSGKVAAYKEGKLSANVLFYPSAISKEQRSLLKNFMVFEQLYLDRFVLIDRTKLPEQVQMFLYERPFSLRRINLGFEQYLDKLFANKAMLNWQEEFVSADEQSDILLRQHRADQAALAGQLATTLPRKGIDYREPLNELHNQLKKSKAIGSVGLEHYPLPHLNELRRVERWFGGPLPEAMLDFYRSLNGFRLSWKSKTSGKDAYLGQLDIAPLLEAFGGEKADQTLDWDAYATYDRLWDKSIKEDEPEYFDRIEKMRIFDRHLVRNQVLMHFEGGQMHFFYWVDRGLTAMEISFEQLIHGVFQTGGLEYYPALLIDSEKMPFDRTEMEEKIRTFNRNYTL